MLGVISTPITPYTGQERSTKKTKDFYINVTNQTVKPFETVKYMSEY